MGCFLACFGTKKDRKRRRPAKRVLPGDQRHGTYEPLQPTVCLMQDIASKPISSVSELGGKPEEQLSLGTRKKVTFDLNVKTYEEVVTHETVNYASESDDKKDNGNKEKEEEEETGKSKQSSFSEDDSVTSSLGSYPSNHRYQNCRDNDDEADGIESDESDMDDDDDDDEDYNDDEEDDVRGVPVEESSESFFSLPMESRNHTCPTPPFEKEVNSPMPTCGSPGREIKTLRPTQNTRDRSQYVNSVLNPVENLTQWKAVKARTAPQLKQHQTKENINFEKEPEIPFSSEPTFKPLPLKPYSNFNHSKPPKHEIAVDASLSNWLGSSGTTPITKTSTDVVRSEQSEKSISQRSNSPRSYEDRPILGALTMEELKQLSASSSPRRSPSRSPEDMPILGTVGSYWNHTGQAMDSSSGSSCKGIPNTTSKYREDKRVNWHSTPFETRLERALNTGSAEAYSSYPPKVF